MNLVPCRKCGSTKIETVCRTFSPEWKERFAICQNCGNVSQAIEWGLNEELDTEFTKRQWNYENGGGTMIIYIVTYWDGAEEPTVTAFNNADAANDYLQYAKKYHKNACVDAVPIYTAFEQRSGNFA